MGAGWVIHAVVRGRIMQAAGLQIVRYEAVERDGRIAAARAEVDLVIFPVRDTRSVRQQLAHGDRHVGEGGTAHRKPRCLVHRLVEIETSLCNQRHDRLGDDDLGDRCDMEQRAVPNRAVLRDVCPTCGCGKERHALPRKPDRTSRQAAHAALPAHEFGQFRPFCRRRGNCGRGASHRHAGQNGRPHEVPPCSV